MTNPFTKNNAKKATVSITKSLFGKAHFISQTTADLLLEGEALIVNSITGEDKEDLRNDRLTRTFTTQAQAVHLTKNMYQAAKDKFSKTKPVSHDDLLLNVAFTE